MGNCNAKVNNPRSVEPRLAPSDASSEQHEPLNNMERAASMSSNPHVYTESEWNGGHRKFNPAMPNNYMMFPMQMHSPIMGGMVPQPSQPEMSHNPVYQMPSIPLPPPVESFSASAPIAMGSAPISASRTVSMSYEGLHPYYQNERLSTVHQPETQTPVTHTELAPGVYKEYASGEIIWDNQYYGSVGEFLHLLKEEDQFALTRGRMGRRMSTEEQVHVPSRAASVAASNISASKWPAPPPRSREPEVPTDVMEHTIPRSPPHEPAPIPQPAQDEVDETTTDDEFLRSENATTAFLSEEDTTDYESQERRRSEPPKKRKVRRRRRKASAPWRGIFSRSRQ